MLRLLRKNKSAGVELGAAGELLFAFKINGLGYLKSTDFATFTEGTAGGYFINDSVFVNGKLTVVGYDGVVFFIKSTTDGINWSLAVGTGLGVPDLRGIAYGNGVYVAVSLNNNVYYSTDAVNWTKATTPATSTILAGRQVASVCFGNGRFVISCTDDRVITSTNGSTWTTISTAMYLGTISFANGKWSGTGRYGDYKWKSTDGLTWSTNGYWSPANMHTGMVYSNGKWYYVRNDGYIYSSTDGVSFSYYAAPGQLQPPGGNKLAVKGNTIAYGSSNGYIVYSRDGGVTWQQKFFASNINFNHLVIV